MAYLTLNAIKAKLKSVQNKFNEHTFRDDDIERNAIFIYYDTKKKRKRSRKEKQTFLDITCRENYRELVKEYDHVVISKGTYGRYYIHIKRYNKLYNVMDMVISERLKTTIESVYEAAESFEKIHSERCVRSEVVFPTGELLFANFFKNNACNDYAFEVPEDFKYKSGYSINHSLGEQRTMQLLSQTHGLAYVQLGNTSASVYKISDDHIILTTTCPYYYTEEDGEEEIPVPEGWELLGEVCCDVWRVEMIDKESFDKGDALPIDHEEYNHNKPFTGKVNPGTWEVKCSYHMMNDDTELKAGRFPVWAELKRKE